MIWDWRETWLNAIFVATNLPFLASLNWQGEELPKSELNGSTRDWWEMTRKTPVWQTATADAYFIWLNAAKAIKFITTSIDGRPYRSAD